MVVQLAETYKADMECVIQTHRLDLLSITNLNCLALKLVAVFAQLETIG